MAYKIPEEPQEHCDFCGENPDFGFDMDWDALLCWMCHLAQNYGLWFMQNRAVKNPIAFLTSDHYNEPNVIAWRDMF